ncbi:uncharacterized protein LOC141863292 [Acropora palmata]
MSPRVGPVVMALLQLLGNLAPLVSSQFPYKMAQQYPQSPDVSNTYVSQAQPAWHYSNYFIRAPQQNGPQQWQTRPQRDPLFIYVPPQNTGQIATQTKETNSSAIQELMRDIATNSANEMVRLVHEPQQRFSIFPKDKNKATEKPVVDYTFDNIRDKQVISESPDGIVGKLVGKFSQSTYSPKCQKGIEFTNGQGHIELDGSKIDAMKKDAMTISAWIRLSRNDRVNTIYGWAGQKGSHHLSIKPIGSPNAAVHWLLKMPNGKVVFDITTEPVIPAGIWTHLTVVYDGAQGKVKIFVNSEKILTTKEAVAKQSHVPWGNPVTVAMFTGNKGEFFDGAMDDFHVFASALMHAEVEELMSNCEFPSDSTLYFVDVSTGSESHSGTSSRVFIKLIGENGEHGEIKLGKKFKKGSTASFNIYSTNIGTPLKIIIRKDTKGVFHTEWYLEKVVVTINDRTDGPSYIFNCNCWIGKEKNDLQKTLTPEKHVDGNWSPWSGWSGCGAGLCGGNKKVRTRSCTNPQPTGGGKKCPGDSFEEAICPVDGGWGAWGSWSLCSKTCGGAMVTRERKCDNPVPQNGGKPCDPKGATETKTDCNQPCDNGPVHGQWSEWSQWSACAKSCGASKVTRKRSCNNPPPQRGGEECPGEATENALDCETPCPVDGNWGEWQEWSECSTTCGPGTRVRTRECDSPAPEYGGQCPGTGQQTEACTIRPCPTNVVDGAWGQWGPYSACSETEFCNRGSQVRTRPCNNPAPQNGGKICPGPESESQECPKTNCKETPQNEAASKALEPNTFIALMCSAKSADLISNSLKNDLVDAVFKNFPKLVPHFNGGYFAINKNSPQFDEMCIEPNKLITIAQLSQLYPSFQSAKSLPFFKIPEPSKHVKGVKVKLKKDKSLHGVEFLLDSASSYNPTATVSLENVMFLYQVLPGNERIVAHGFKRIGNALFSSYASLVGEEIAIEGSSSQTISSEEIESALSLQESDLMARMARHLIPDDHLDVFVDKFSEKKNRQAMKHSLVIRHKADHTGRIKGQHRNVRKQNKARKFSLARSQASTRIKTQRNMVPGYLYEPVRKMDDRLLDHDLAPYPLLYNIPASPQAQGLTEKLDQKVLNLVKKLGLNLVTLSDLHLSVKADLKEVILRVAGRAAPKVIGGWFDFEIVRKDIFAVAFTADQAGFMDFTEKAFNKKLGLFSALEQISFGISFAQKGFKVTPETKFKHEPLQSLMKKQVPEGLFFAAQAKFATDCGKEPVCTFGKILMGKNSWLKFHGGINTAGVKIFAGVYDIPIQGELKFSKVELFVEVKYGKASVLPSLGFTIELDVPVKGEVDDKGEKLPGSSLQLGGTLSVTAAAEIGTTLYMKGMWRKAFGLSFLSIGNIEIGFTVTVAAGLPTEFKFNGRLEIGHDCQGKDDFEVQGRCISGEALIGVSANPAKQYIYGELSAVTLGKILRMLGSKLQLPPAVEQSGFPKGLIISASWADQKVPYAGATKNIKKGVFIQGKINILGFAPTVEILLNDKEIKFDLDLDPIKLSDKVEVFRSLKEKKKGPKFYLHAKRSPLQAEIYIEGAVIIFGNELGIKFKLTNERIEAEVAVNLFNVFKAAVSISAGYGNPFAQAGFQANFTIETGLGELSNKTAQLLVKGLQAARKALEKAKETLRETKAACERNAGSFCDVCKKIACDEISEECKRAMDEFKHFIGKKLDSFGQKMQSIGQKVVSGFKKERSKRYMDLLAMGMNCYDGNKYLNYTNKRCQSSFHSNSSSHRTARRKRFVGKLLCEKLAAKACSMTKDLCTGSCDAIGHITKGMCKALDVAHHGLHLLEKTTYWAERAILATAKNIFVIHKLSFQTHLTASPLQSSVSLGADISIFGSRGEFTLEFNLADPLKNIHKLADTALAFFKKLFSPRFSKEIYDKPSEKTDYEFSAEFRVQNNGSEECLSVAPKSEPGSSVILGSCEGQLSQWMFTLTGAIMNVDSGFCVAMGREQGLNVLQQQICDVESDEQKFTCKGNQITPVKDSGLCVTASAGKTGTGKKEARLLKCSNNTDDQEWLPHGDPRALSICHKFVEDFALKKPALQSSLFAVGKDVKDDEGNPILIPGVGPELAVDGNMSTTPSLGSCSMTALEANPWWKVDLESEHIVTDINVVSSTGPLSSPLTDVEIRVGIQTDYKLNPMCGERVRQFGEGEVWTAECNPPIPGRYVSVSLVTKGQLIICEVAVFARLENQGKCGSEQSRKRDEIANSFPDDN